MLIDAVLPTWQRDLEELNQLGLGLAYTLDTHIHADHITAARKRKLEAGSRIAHPAVDSSPAWTCQWRKESRWTSAASGWSPCSRGHTDGHHAYRVDGRASTGDALLIDGCGRTDFQNGDAPTLYRSVHEKLFALREDTLVYPAHDYQGRRVSSIGQEKTRNPRLGGNKPLAQFVKIMQAIETGLSEIHRLRGAGQPQCGVCPTGVPEDLQQYCAHIEASLQG